MAHFTLCTPTHGVHALAYPLQGLNTSLMV